MSVKFEAKELAEKLVAKIHDDVESKIKGELDSLYDGLQQNQEQGLGLSEWIEWYGNHVFIAETKWCLFMDVLDAHSVDSLTELLKDKIEHCKEQLLNREPWSQSHSNPIARARRIAETRAYKQSIEFAKRELALLDQPPFNEE